MQPVEKSPPPGGVKEQRDGLLRYCRFLTKNQWDADEIAQESLVRALEHYHQEEWTQALLKRIAYSVWIDITRKRRWETVEAPCYEESYQLSGFECAHLLRSLTPKQTVTFVLKEAFQFRIAEIASILNMSETGIKALLSRARNRLKNLQDDPGVGEPSDIQNQLDAILIRTLRAQDPALLLQFIPTLLARQSTVSGERLHVHSSLNLSNAA
ncbi:hypothetical protein ASG66_04925 [Bacillus sp. Leaf406]|uniref:sigma factor-like helix-turn-helix DNA-binding protein n=1 Tax=Rossellomorea marisflavi TaxID=189381 RepID=UPI0007022356|nr:sigma factor-like helix-turn-helix DNA-binding protein [Rossellomorea marisflavi]KQU63748.1 hypothetical protein ASG66_04925 [Bacillus sp. Leaf406]UKS66564.1 hypothetical protein K6T23_06865 [Rossellomorea marisflavi]